MKQINGVLLTVAFCGTLSAQRLQDIKTIFVAPLSGENTAVADMLNAKLISHLAKYHGVTVVEAEDNADAILTGSGLLETTTNAYGRVSYHVQAAMRLVSKDGVVLWADDISSRPFARSATSSFADNVAKKLLQAIVPEDRQK